jgi:hypothetical protein
MRGCLITVLGIFLSSCLYGDVPFIRYSGNCNKSWTGDTSPAPHTLSCSSSAVCLTCPTKPIGLTANMSGVECGYNTYSVSTSWDAQSGWTRRGVALVAGPWGNLYYQISQTMTCSSERTETTGSSSIPCIGG